jgi:tetratricopeptide (TPR) repeat protein
LNPIFNMTDTRQLRIAFFLLLCLLGTIAFGGLMEHPMNVVGDEPAAIQDARLILENPLNWMSPERVMVVRPPVDLFFMIGEVFWGGRDAGYQNFQTVLHIVAAWLVFCVLRKQKMDLTLCMIAAVFFLLNVAPFRAVQWVICINYILACIFALICVWFLLRYFETTQRRLWVGAMSMVCCAVFSHPASVAVILFCIYIMWQNNESLRRILILVGVGGGCIALAFLASPNHVQTQGVINGLNFERLVTNPFWYLGRLATSSYWFSPLAIQNEPHELEIMLGILFCMGVSWLFVRRRQWMFTHWAIWTVIMVLPFVNNASDRQIVGPSRQLYLASVGSSIALAWMICYFCQKINGKRLQQMVLLGLSCLIGGMSFFSIKKAEAIDYWFVGRSYIASRQIDTGLALFEKAYEHGRDILPPNFYTQFAILAFGNGLPILHRIQYALEIYPKDDHIKVLLGVAHFLSDTPNEHQKGKAIIVSAVQAGKNKEGLAQDLTAALQNAATHLHQNQHYDRAIELYQFVLDVRPDYVIAWANIGRAFFAKDLYQKGIDALLRATELQPDFWEAWQVLGDMLWMMADYENAIAALQNAHVLNGESVEVPYTIGLCYERLDAHKEAIFWYYKALKMDPGHTKTIHQLSALEQ